jgi:uncharacterized protein (TIGR02246 family)
MVPLLAVVLALQQSVVIRDVTVIDGTGAPPRPHMTVVTQGNRISRMESAAKGSVPVPRGAMVVEGRGRYLLPGFVDAHAHVALGPVHLEKTTAGPAMRVEYDHAASREMLQTLLAFGVTAVRNPAGPTSHVIPMRDSLDRGLIPGPRMRTAGEVIDVIKAPGLVATVASEADVRAEVDRQAAAGVDFIKLYAGLQAPLVRAGIDEAHRKGLRALGHLTFTSWTDAARAGIDGIVHISPGSPALLPADRRPDYLRTFRGTQFMARWFEFADLDSPEIREMTAALVEHGVVLDFTLVTFYNIFFGDRPEVTEAPDLAYAPPTLLRNWREEMTLSQDWSADDYQRAHALWPRVLAFARHLSDAGVQLTVGTDTPNPWTAPGASFHRELQLYVDAGIPASDVLQMATRNGAAAIGLEAEIGTIAVGKRADLVLLAADPLADIANTRRIMLVVHDGRARTPAQLLPLRLRDRGIAAEPALDSARRVVDAMVDAVTRQDGASMLALYARSGAVTTFQGMMIASRDTLARLLGAWGPGGARRAALAWDDLRFTVAGEDAVAVTGRFRYAAAGGSAPPDTLRGVWTALIARDGARWAIIHEHESFARPPGRDRQP